MEQFLFDLQLDNKPFYQTVQKLLSSEDIEYIHRLNDEAIEALAFWLNVASYHSHEENDKLKTYKDIHELMDAIVSNSSKYRNQDHPVFYRNNVHEDIQQVPFYFRVVNFPKGFDNMIIPFDWIFEFKRNKKVWDLLIMAFHHIFNKMVPFHPDSPVADYIINYSEEFMSVDTDYKVPVLDVKSLDSREIGILTYKFVHRTISWENTKKGYTNSKAYKFMSTVKNNPSLLLNDSSLLKLTFKDVSSKLENYSGRLFDWDKKMVLKDMSRYLMLADSFHVYNYSSFADHTLEESDPPIACDYCLVMWNPYSPFGTHYRDMVEQIEMQYNGFPLIYESLSLIPISDSFANGVAEKYVELCEKLINSIYELYKSRIYKCSNLHPWV